MSYRQKAHFKDEENYDFRVRLVSSTFIKAQKLNMSIGKDAFELLFYKKN